MSLEDKKYKFELCKRAFECKLKNTYGIEILNNMTRINYDEVNKIDKSNLLYDMINPPKRTKNLNGHYSPVLNECMNTRNDREKFKKFRILLFIGCSFTIAMGSIVQKLKPEKGAVMQCHTQAGNITNNFKVHMDFTIPALRTMNVMM